MPENEDRKTLDRAVLDALDFHSRAPTAEVARLPDEGHGIVVGSGNGLATGRILYRRNPVAFANESHLVETLAKDRALDWGVVVSASGSKDSTDAVAALQERGIPTTLLTCRGDSPAASLVDDPDRVIVSPTIAEMITYNTATYLGMILASTGERAADILKHLETRVAPVVPDDLAAAGAFYFLVPTRFEIACEMLSTKFDELFGGRLNGRAFTPEQTSHAKTVVPWEREVFVAVGHTNETFGSRRVSVELPSEAGYATFLATAYFFIGRIQAAFPSWFLNHAGEYASMQASLFRRT